MPELLAFDAVTAGYGNAIVPPLAAEFVTAFMESLR